MDWHCAVPVWHGDNMSDAFLDAAQDLLGSRGLTRDAEVMQPWLTDWRGRYHGKARALASPASTGEVSELVKLCARHRVPIVPQGGNSGMSGGATPDESGHALLLSLRRMDAIRRWDEDARQVVCEAGVVLQTLHDRAGERGLRFPLTLGGQGIGHHRRADLDQCGGDAGAAPRDDARAGARAGGGAARWVRARCARGA